MGLSRCPRPAASRNGCGATPLQDRPPSSSTHANNRQQRRERSCMERSLFPTAQGMARIDKRPSRQIHGPQRRLQHGL
eukprot:scaffold261_cov336-Pavlova_lutheri.AAC.37